MVIDNKNAVVGVRIRRRLFLLLLAIALILLIFKETFLGIERLIYIIGLNALYLLYYSWGILRDYHYFYYNDVGIKLNFKYYSLALFSKKHRSVEIEKNIFYKFHFIKKWLGIRLYLVLYQQMGGGIAKYPPISLGLVKKKDINKLRESLQLIQKSNHLHN